MTEENAPAGQHEVRVRVRYAETDQMGVVYHGNLLAYFEVGRTDLIRSLGMPYTEMEKRDVFLAVVEAGFEYRRPIRYDDELRILTVVESLGKASIAFRYEVFRGEERVVEGRTRHASVDGEGRPRRFPDEIAELLSKTMVD